MDFHDTVVINFATSGDKQVLAGQAAVAANPQDTPAKRIYVGGYVLVAAAAVTVTWKDGTTAISGPIPLAANTPLVVGFSGAEVFGPLGKGNDLTLNLSGNIQVSGHAIVFQQ